MKFLLLIIFFINFLFPNILGAQQVESLIFRYRCVPTSTMDYSIEVQKDKFILKTTEMIANNKGRIIKVDTSSYTYHFVPKEKQTLDSIIKVNRLDSIGLYEQRTTEWGTLWQVQIERNSITYNIDLPNYNNVGLESLIQFIACLIPKNELPRFECKKCK